MDSIVVDFQNTMQSIHSIFQKRVSLLHYYDLSFKLRQKTHSYIEYYKKTQ